MNLEQRLETFARENNFRGKGALSLALVITRRALRDGLPLAPENLLTKARGQVAGLGKSAVQAILKDYGIERVLAAEAGRTNRGNIQKMGSYVTLLNNLHGEGSIELKAVERWWIKKVEKFFAGQPFKLKLDRSKSLRAVVRDLLDQVLKRQRETPGMTYMGTVLQHLVGAKLESILPEGTIQHHGASVADAPSDREGDFTVRDTAIHVTTAPSEALIQKCRRNLDADVRPVIVTTQDGAQGAEALAKDAGIDGRIDVFEIEQFIATNVYGKSGFAQTDRRMNVSKIVERYNAIVEAHETDPSLKIEVAR